MLVQYPHTGLVAGIDEAGRGCLAGPVVAAAVILPATCTLPNLDDSKKLSHSQRMAIRPYIWEQALAWNVGMISSQRIDEINILQATYEAMHEAVGGLSLSPDLLLVDGNRFRAYPSISHECIIKGDGTYLSIAAASILAKTYRDEVMGMLHETYPQYNWASNKGYPAKSHKTAIAEFGPTPYHRRSFNWS